MASTKVMQARARARKKGVQISEMNLGAFQKQIKDDLTRAAEALVNASSPSNVDMSLIAEPVLRTRQLTLGGTKISVCLYTDARIMDIINRKCGDEFLAAFQIWSRGGSMLLPFSREIIEDAGRNHEGKTVIAPDNIISRAVAALRLNSGNAVIHHLAMHMAYEETKPDSGQSLYSGIDSLGIYRVWD
jgi:hypothetical protein